MRLLALSSAGKDSCYAIWWAQLRGWEVVRMVTVRVRDEDSMMFQIPTVELTRWQHEASGIPLLNIEVSGDAEWDIQQLEGGLKNQLDGIDGIICGALRSDYQKTRLERMCERLGVRSFTPLWHHPPEQHMQDLVDHGFEVIITSVSADGLGAEWLGVQLDKDSLERLRGLSIKHRFNLDGEGGEFETAVVAAPWMEARLRFEPTRHSSGNRHWLEFDEAKLV